MRKTVLSRVRPFPTRSTTVRTTRLSYIPAKQSVSSRNNRVGLLLEMVVIRVARPTEVVRVGAICVFEFLEHLRKEV
jgi:hypothetical protein